uniref:N-acetylgalactosamine kinase isoform X1 n=2 Tax=Myxine glutinosa TaxID=7769 RepID=UPI00358F8D7E
MDTERLARIEDHFKTKFGSTPQFYARAPGRVNLIGEHVDYCGYSVLPMAIQQDILIAVASNNMSEINLSNTNPRYCDFSNTVHDIAIDTTRPFWYNYFLCGFKGVQEHLGLSETVGMNCLVDGTIPANSGLSSSSALVCCAGLATMAANQQTISMKELAEICTRSERYVGTQGGGMDQSISFLARKGSAMLIDFEPLRATEVSMPPGAVFVIASSCVEMNKAATAHFNVRVAECRIAAKILAKAMSLRWQEVVKLKDVQDAQQVSTMDMLAMVETYLHPEPYSRHEICSALELSNTQLDSMLLSQNTTHVQSFKLYQRAKHVFGEADRVSEFRLACHGAPGQGGTDAAFLRSVGELMNASHSSCRDLYECSCDELDDLVNICLKSGAVGSRLTGAGWGGCTVSLVPAERLPAFMDGVRRGFYEADPRRMHQLAENFFATEPAAGASILKHQPTAN